MFSPKGTVFMKMLCLSLFGLVLAMPAWAEEMVIPVHRSALIDLPRNMSEVIVADPEVADVYPHGKNKLSIIGKKIGQTSVRVFDEESGVITSVDVLVAYDLPAIRKALKDLMPYEMIGVEMVNTNVALTGQVTSTSAAAQAVKIVNEFVQPYQTATGGVGGATGGASGAGGARGGKAAGEVQSTVLNLMEVTTGQQVMLRVRVGEIRRTALKNLGVDIASRGIGSNSAMQLFTGTGLAGAVNPDLGPGTFDITGQDLRGFASYAYSDGEGDLLSVSLQALERNGLFKVLAEPNLVALSGEEAQFLAGGEFPIIVPQNENTLTVEFKPFGVSVKFKPTVLTENRIRMSVEPEVSEISEEGAIQLNDFFVPAINTRRASTIVELAPGESFMIAGLISDNLESTIDQVPGLGEIPILSALFRSTSFQREETELVLAVTPYLVDPLVSSDVKLPTDNFAPASVMERFFYGALGSMTDNAQRIGQTPQVEGPIGFMVD